MNSMAAITAKHSGATRASQSGIALAIVVWFIAGMSLLVAGIVAHARVDSRMAQLHVARAKAVAAGDGAIQLRLAGGDSAKRAGVNSLHQLGDLEVEVRLQSAAGLIDLNSASQELLTALFLVAGKLDLDEAKMMANNVVKWRTPQSKYSATRRQSRFDAIEDLMRVEGITRSVLDGVRDFVVAGAAGKGQMNWKLAPRELLDLAAQAGPKLARASNANFGRVEASGKITDDSSTVYRADAIVRYGDQTWLRRRWVAPGQTSRHSSLPWRILRTEPARVYGE